MFHMSTALGRPDRRAGWLDKRSSVLLSEMKFRGQVGERTGRERQKEGSLQEKKADQAWCGDLGVGGSVGRGGWVSSHEGKTRPGGTGQRGERP